MDGGRRQRLSGGRGGQRNDGAAPLGMAAPVPLHPPESRRQAMGDRSISQPGQQFVSPHSTPSGAMVHRHEWDAKAFVNFYAMLLTTCCSAFDPTAAAPAAPYRLGC
jgi:hypothetical protein